MNTPCIPVYLGGELRKFVMQAANAESLSASSYVRRAVVERLKRDGLVQHDERGTKPFSKGGR